MCPNPQFSEDLVTFTEEILDRKLHFLARIYNIWAESKGFGNWNSYMKTELLYLQFNQNFEVKRFRNISFLSSRSFEFSTENHRLSFWKKEIFWKKDLKKLSLYPF